MWVFSIGPVVVIVVVASAVVVVVSGVGLTTFALTLNAAEGSFEAREFGSRAHL